MALRQSYRLIGNVSHRTALPEGQAAVTLLFKSRLCHENLSIHKTVNGYNLFCQCPRIFELVNNISKEIGGVEFIHDLAVIG